MTAATPSLSALGVAIEASDHAAAGKLLAHAPNGAGRLGSFRLATPSICAYTRVSISRRTRLQVDAGVLKHSQRVLLIPAMPSKYGPASEATLGTSDCIWRGN
jgi:hypothetical protein